MLNWLPNAHETNFEKKKRVRSSHSHQKHIFEIEQFLMRAQNGVSIFLVGAIIEVLIVH